MAVGVQTHGADQFGAGLRSVLNQVGADGGADDEVEHRKRFGGTESIVAGRGGGITARWCIPQR